MKFVIVSGNPKKDGLTRRMTDEIIRGAKDGGADVEEINVCNQERCRMCNGGAGKCLSDEHACVFGKDGFNEAQGKIKEADAVAFISPVYWEEVSEGLKSFMDRFRRCESSGIFNQRQAALTGKPVLLVASAGGSGMDMIEPLKEMERFVHHTSGRVFDAIGINRWNQSYKGRAIYEAAKAMAEGHTVGETIPYEPS